MSGEDASFSSYSIHVGHESVVRCNTYADTTPILALDAGHTAICITTRGKTATKAAVEFDRALVREARNFADEMERMHTAHLDGDDSTHKAAGSDAA